MVTLSPMLPSQMTLRRLNGPKRGRRAHESESLIWQSSLCMDWKVIPEEPYSRLRREISGVGDKRIEHFKRLEKEIQRGGGIRIVGTQQPSPCSADASYGWVA